MSITLGIFCAAIVGASLLGGLLPLASVLTHTRLQLYLSFAAGTMLGAAFFHMLPEAIAEAPTTALDWTAAGLLAVFLLERFFAFHHHEAPSNPDDPCSDQPHQHSHSHGHSAGLIDAEAPGRAGPGTKGTSLVWSVAAIGLAVHTLIGGVALASAAASSARGQIGAAAWGVFIATLVHKPADALTIVSLMLRAGVPRPVAHMVNLTFSLMIPLGVGLFFAGLGLVGEEASVGITAAALAFSAGTFLCIALSDLLPELHFHAHDRFKLSAALLSGLGLMFAAATWE